MRSKAFSTSWAPNTLKISKQNYTKQHILLHSLARRLHSAGIIYAQDSMHTLYLSVHAHKHIAQWKKKTFLSLRHSWVVSSGLCRAREERWHLCPSQAPPQPVSKLPQGLSSLGHDPAQRLKLYWSLWLLGKGKSSNLVKQVLSPNHLIRHISCDFRCSDAEPFFLPCPAGVFHFHE